MLQVNPGVGFVVILVLQVHTVVGLVVILVLLVYPEVGFMVGVILVLRVYPGEGFMVVVLYYTVSTKNIRKSREEIIIIFMGKVLAPELLLPIPPPPHPSVQLGYFPTSYNYQHNNVTSFQ